MINCEFHPLESCEPCKHYNDCELILPFTIESSNKLNEIRDEIKEVIFDFENRSMNESEYVEEMNELRKEEFRILKQLKIKRDRKVKL